MVVVAAAAAVCLPLRILLRGLDLDFENLTRYGQDVQVQHCHGGPYSGRLGSGELPWVLAPQLRALFAIPAMRKAVWCFCELVGFGLVDCWLWRRSK